MDFDNNLSLEERIEKRRKQKTKRNIVGVISLSIIFLAIALILINFNGIVDFAQGSVASSSGQQTNSSSTPTAPKVSSTPAKTDQSSVKLTDTTALKKSLQNYIKKYKGTYGIYYLNLSDGASFGINDKVQFFAASTVKVPINLYLFKKIEAGSINPNSKMTYLSQDHETGTGIIQYSKYGTKYKISELSRLSIEYSDNCATNMLIRLLGKQNYKNFMKEIGGSVITSSNISCPKDMGIYMKRVYEFTKSNKTLGSQYLGYLENTKFNDRIPVLLPKSLKIAHKIGNYWSSDWGIVQHDVGIVYTKKPFIIAVMSKHASSVETANNVVAHISKMVYDFQVKLK